MRVVQPGEFYRHFKGNYYQIITLAHHSETDENLVVYQALYGEYKVCARPYDMFISKVDKEKYPEVKQALRKGKEIVDIEVENALFKKALGYNVPVQKAFKLKDIVYGENGKKISETERIEYAEEEIHVPADTTAQIFWLKNRKKAQWRDKVEYEANTGEINKVKELLSKITDEANNG